MNHNVQDLIYGITVIEVILLAFDAMLVPVRGKFTPACARWPLMLARKGLSSGLHALARTIAPAKKDKKKSPASSP